MLVGAPKARRRFLDRGVVGSRPAALEVLGRYREALRQKRQLLPAGRRGIEIWNELLAAAGRGGDPSCRHDYVERLERMLLARSSRQSGLPFPPVELRYRPSPATGWKGSGVIADSPGAHRRRASAGARCRSLGPHRDELEILWGGHEIRRVASAGERKALSLLLLAAHGRVMEAAGTAPRLPPGRRGCRAGAADHRRRLEASSASIGRRSSPPRTGPRSG